MSAPYLFSKAIDPIFALSIGVMSAAVRINREEKEKGKSTQESFESLKRRAAIVWDDMVGQKSTGDKAG